MELLGGCAMNEINICKEVGAKIRYFRKLQGYTLESFATICTEVNPSFLNMSGVRFLSIC